MKIYGTTGARELRPGYGYRPDVGWTTVRRWRGTEEECLEIANVAAADSTVVDIRVEHEDGPWYVVALTFGFQVNSGGGTAPVDPDSLVTIQWSLPPDRLSRSLWELPVVQASLANVEAEHRATFRKVVKDFLDGTYSGTATTPLGLIAEVPGVVNPQVLVALIGDLAAGVEAYQVDTYVLSKRVVFPNGASTRPAYTNTNRMFTTATLLADEPTIPAVIRENLPTGYWLKGAPSVTQADATRWELEQQWQFAEDYSRLIYGAPL